MNLSRSRRVLRLAALLLFAVMLSGAAAVPARAAGSSSAYGVGYTSVLYDNSNGLPTSDVNAVVQTAEGFLWIGSYSGLIRYDGNEFYRYSSSTGLSSVVSLYVDSKNRLWIGTNDAGVFLLEGDSFRNYDRREELRSSTVRAILEDDDGNLLVATTEGLSFIDPDGEMRLLNEPMLNGEYIWELAKGPDGVIYGLTKNGLLFSVENLRMTASYSTASMGCGTINTVYPDPDMPGWFYLGTQESSIVYGELSKNMAGAKRISVAPQQMVRCIRRLGGLLWVCSNTGIGYYDGERYIPLDDIEMNNSVEHVIQDFEGNLWFTSARQGLMKIVPTRFTDVFRYAGLAPTVVNTTFLRDGLLYIGTDTGLILLDEKLDRVENGITEHLNGVRIRSIHDDSRGRLWFGTNSANGIVRYDPADGSIFNFNEDAGLASNWSRTVLELSDGRIAAASDKGVNLIRGDEVIGLYGAEEGLKNPAILCLEEGPNGEIYAGSDGDGIYVIADGKVSRLGREDGLRSDVILRMRRDTVDPELYWVITSNSIAWLRGSEISVVHGFPYSNNFDLFFDDDQRMWVLSSNGIYVVKREDMLRDEKLDYTLYDTKSGLPCAATANSYSYLEDDGTLYISAATGVSSVNINDDTDEQGRVRLCVPFLYITRGRESVYVPVESDTVVLPSDCSSVTVHAYAFSYTLNNPALHYDLEGFSAAMSGELTQHEMRPISYTNLPGGTYQFHLSQLNTRTGQVEQTYTLTIVKEKKLTEQLWFWGLIALLGILLAAGSVMLYYRRKTRALLEKQRQHKLLINEMSSTFARCIDMKDPYTNGHSHRVAKYSAMLARQLGKSEEDVEQIYNIALLHDIGKIGIPDSILNKPGRLTDEEFEIMRSHSRLGYDILKEVSIAPELAIGAGYHHERLDGHGYPWGLKKEDIPEFAQIIAVADTFDAMYSTRPYRKRLSLETVCGELQRIAGTQLNPDVVQALMDIVKDGGISEENAPA